jgi:protein gp37
MLQWAVPRQSMVPEVSELFHNSSQDSFYHKFDNNTRINSYSYKTWTGSANEFRTSINFPSLGPNQTHICKYSHNMILTANILLIVICTLPVLRHDYAHPMLMHHIYRDLSNNSETLATTKHTLDSLSKAWHSKDQKQFSSFKQTLHTGEVQTSKCHFVFFILSFFFFNFDSHSNWSVHL